jgi:putative DNA primase/helicase
MSRKKSVTTFREPCTDAGNAEAIAALCGNVLRYDHKQGRWLIWNEQRIRWEEDTSRRVRVFAKNAARHRAKAALSIKDATESTRQFKWARQSESAYALNVALDLAKSEPPIEDDGKGWDADPMLLGVANGVLDLRTGKLRSPTRQDQVTKRSPLAFDPYAKCVRWRQFLGEVFGDDTELIRFIQKAVGYTLTGSVEEHCLFALHGTGRNGKTTFLEVLLHLVGDYGIDLPFSNLEIKHYPIGEGVNLPGARFAKSVETRRGGQLDEGRVKSWTGGDTISIRPLHRNVFAFQPTHKLWLAFNHKPEIKDASPGMWSRIRLIPFERSFEKYQADKKLTEKLKAEASGILNWALEGCAAWQTESLGTPVAVEKATGEYEQESDILAPFIAGCCEADVCFSVPFGELWEAYKKHCGTSTRAMSQKEFSERLDEKGFKSTRSGHERIRVRTGLRVRKVDADARTDADASLRLVPSGEFSIEEVEGRVRTCPHVRRVTEMPSLLALADTD